MIIPQGISNFFSQQFKIINAQNVSGGCINSCAHLHTDKGDYFLKWNSARAYPGMFEAEAKGLRLMASSDSVPVPQPFEVGEAEGLSFILMEYIPRGAAKSDSMFNLGRALAQMHRSSAENFGLEQDNYIGSLPQSNRQHKIWSEFFINERLRPLLIKTMKSGLLFAKDERDFESLFAKLDSLYPDEKPALLHGDLWSGNYLIAGSGQAYLIDPAVYYGHREMDVAMTKLFGGFNSDFYSGYNAEYALQVGWQQRIDLWNLYPLLVHVNLFGGGYAGQLRDCLSRFI